MVLVRIISFCFILSIALLKFIREKDKDLLVGEDDIPLKIDYPELSQKIEEILKNLKFKRNIYLFVRQHPAVNAISEANNHEGYIILYEGLLQLREEEIIAAVYHEIYHLIYWPVHKINKLFSSMLTEMIQKLYQQSLKVEKRFFLSKILLIDSFINLFMLTLHTFHFIIIFFSRAFSVIIDENLADKFVVDQTRKKTLINVIKHHSHISVERYSNLINIRHLEPDIRVKLIEAYHTHKFIRKDLKKKFAKVFLKFLLLFISVLVFMRILFLIIPIASQYVMSFLLDLWLSLFHYEENVATMWGINVLLSIYILYSIIKLIRRFRIMSKLMIRKEILKIFMLKSMLAFFLFGLHLLSNS